MLGETSVALSPRKKWLMLGAVGCGIFLLMGAMVAIQFGLQFRRALVDLRDAQQTVDIFLAAAGNRDYTGAYDALSAKLVRQKSFAQFKSELAANPDHFQVAETQFDEKAEFRHEERTVKLIGTLKLRNGERVPARFFLIVEGGYWLIDSYSVGH